MIRKITVKKNSAIILAIIMIMQVVMQISAFAAGGFDAFEPILASEYSAEEGTSFYKGAVTAEGNDAWIKLKGVRFGAEGPKSVKFLYSAAGESTKAEIRIDSLSGYKMADVTFEETSNMDIYKTNSNSAVEVTGTHDIYIIFKSGKVYIKHLWFSKKESETLGQFRLQIPYDKKGINENTKNNTIMFVGSPDIYVSNVPETLGAPVYKNGEEIMYPAEAICKAAKAEYSCKDNAVNITMADNIITFAVDDKAYRFNGEIKELPVKIEKKNGEIFVPEALALQLGLKIYKNDDGFIALSDREYDLLTDKEKKAEIDYLTAVYTADEVDEDAVQLYVSPTGSDSSEGTLNSPLRTLEGARNKVRALKEKGMTKDIIVNFRGGYYKMDSTTEFTEKDSGENGHRVIYRSYKDEKPTFGMYEVLKYEDFTAVQDEKIAKRFDENVRDKVIQIDLKKYGYDYFGLIFPRSYGEKIYAPVELYIDSKNQTLARYPNEGFIPCAEVVVSGSKFAATSGDGTLSMPAIIRFEEEEPLSWQDSDDIYLYGQWDYGWVTNEQKPLIDKEKKQMKLQYMSFGVNRAASTRYYYKNVLEELDIPGEYYIDRKTGILYLYPNGDISNSEIIVTKMIDGTEHDEWQLAEKVAAHFEDRPSGEIKAKNDKYLLVNFKNASHITIDGLNFKYTAGTAVNIEDGYNIIVENSEVACAGLKAFEILGGYDHVIRNCYMHELGDGGMRIIKAGDRNTLTTSGIKIVNNEIIDYDLLTGGYAGGVYIDVCEGVTVKNNRMSGSKHFAVGYYGNDNVIQYNDISDVLQISDDAGAIYSFQSASYWNNNISYNYFHNIKPAFHFSDAEGESTVHHNLVTGIYADNHVGGNRVIGNISVNSGTNVMFLHGGAGNDIINNMFVSTGDKNVVRGAISGHACSDAYPAGTLSDVPTSSDIWKERYPDLAEHIGNPDNYGKMRKNKINGNIIYARGLWDMDIQLGEESVKEGNITFNTAALDAEGSIVNVPFVDVDNQDYRLKNIKDFEMAFDSVDSAIDFANMGLSADYPFADKNEAMDRLYIKSDKFNSGVANYKAKQGEEIQLELVARGKTGYVVDLSAANISYTSSDSNVASVTADGKVTVKSAGVAKITANVSIGGVSKSIYVNIYGDDAKWNAETVYTSAEMPYTLYFNFKKSDNKNAALLIDGKPYFELNTVFEKLGFKVENLGDKIRISDGKGEITLYPGEKYMDYGKNKTKLDNVVCKEINNSLYVTEEFIRTVEGVAVHSVHQTFSYYLDFNEVSLGDKANVASKPVENIPQVEGRVIDVGELIAQEEKWNLNGMNATIEDGVLKIAPGGERRTAIFTEKLGAADAVHMKFKNDFGGSWSGITLKAKSAWDVAWGGGQGYYLCMYEDRWEMQSFSDAGNIWFDVIDCPIKKGEWCDLEFGAVNVPGGVEIYLIVNGEELFRTLDDQAPITEPGFFQIDGNIDIEVEGVN